jgi:hypothetical protein
MIRIYGEDEMPGVSIGVGGWKGILMPLALVIVVFSFLASGAISEDWSSYKPAYSPGSDQDDWWTAYPAQSAKGGSSVQHLDWVLDSLKENPVLILVHSSSCRPCVEQIAGIKEVLAGMGTDVKYYDILAEGDGIQKATDLINVYSPSQGLYPPAVPTTVFLTLIKGTDGKVVVAWHSVEDAMSVDKISAYVKDSIYYHRQNAADWR